MNLRRKKLNSSSRGEEEKEIELFLLGYEEEKEVELMKKETELLLRER